MWIIILKFISLYLAVKYTYVNTAKIIKNKSVPAANTTIMSLGIAGFVILQFLL